MEYSKPDRERVVEKVNLLEELTKVRYQDHHETLIGGTDQAYENIRKALIEYEAKNTPKKPIKFIDDPTCPRCHHFMTKKHYNYCRDCGQKLDWSVARVQK